MKFIVCLLLFAQFVHAGCESVNLVTEKNSPFNQIPVYDQGNSGTCYAYVASQMINFWAIRNGLPKLAHPFWTAFRFAVVNNEKDLSGGSMPKAIEAFKKADFCSYASVEKSINDYSSRYGLPVNRIIGLIERQGVFTEEDTSIPGCDVAGLYRYFRSLPVTKLADSPYLLYNIIAQKCDKKRLHKTMAPKSYGHQGSNGVVESMASSALFSRRTPLSLNHCSTMWTDPNYEGVKSFQNRSIVKPNCGSHAALLVGQKLVNNQCHYLVRNTWGNSLSGAGVKGKKCLCKHKKTGAFKDDCTRAADNNGQWSVEGCWMPARHVIRNTNFFTTLE